MPATWFCVMIETYEPHQLRLSHAHGPIRVSHLSRRVRGPCDPARCVNASPSSHVRQHHWRANPIQAVRARRTLNRSRATQAPATTHTRASHAPCTCTSETSTESVVCGARRLGSWVLSASLPHPTPVRCCSCWVHEQPTVRPARSMCTTRVWWCPAAFVPVTPSTSNVVESAWTRHAGIAEAAPGRGWRGHGRA